MVLNLAVARATIVKSQCGNAFTHSVTSRYWRRVAWLVAAASYNV